MKGNDIMKFKVGDRVNFFDWHFGVDNIATIIYINNKNDMLIQFDKPMAGHDGNGKGKKGCCWWVSGQHLEIIIDVDERE
jgi:hypothetical protein